MAEFKTLKMLKATRTRKIFDIENERCRNCGCHVCEVIEDLTKEFERKFQGRKKSLVVCSFEIANLCYECRHKDTSIDEALRCALDILGSALGRDGNE